MKFFSDLKSSVYDPEFYANIPFIKGGRAFGYLALLALVLALIHSAFNLPDVLKFQKQIPGWIKQAVEYYPKELEVKIQNGRVSTNVDEPYFIKGPDQQNLLVIDTKTPFSEDKFEEYGAPVWLTKDSVVSKEENKTQIQSLSEVEEFRIDRTIVDQTVSKISPLITAFSGLLVPLTVFVLWSYYFLFKLFYLLFAAFLILFSAKAFKLPWKYSDAYKAGLFAITPALAVSLIFDVFNLPRFMLMFTVITGITVVVNLAGIKPAKTS